MNTPNHSYTAFHGHRRISAGALSTVALAAKRALDNGADATVLIFDDSNGRSIDIDMRGSEADMLDRLALQEAAEAKITGTSEEPPIEGKRERGRPKLGVVAREVTLLPRHWEWLAAQPGGASVALRKLVDEARRTNTEKDRRRQAHECAYRFMSAVAGDLPVFEEATRALFAHDQARFEALIAAWPDDVRVYASWLAFNSDRNTDQNR
ncbi:MAG: DUF2239 family protein [Anaerolineae bacterium]|nr:DUF2239 family protein [Anaerolineae bacterium]